VICRHRLDRVAAHVRRCGYSAPGRLQFEDLVTKRGIRARMRMSRLPSGASRFGRRFAPVLRSTTCSARSRRAHLQRLAQPRKSDFDRGGWASSSGKSAWSVRDQLNGLKTKKRAPSRPPYESPSARVAAACSVSHNRRFRRDSSLPLRAFRAEMMGHPPSVVLPVKPRLIHVWALAAACRRMKSGWCRLTRPPSPRPRAVFPRRAHWRHSASTPNRDPFVAEARRDRRRDVP